jgi:hypothetical protein
VTLKKYKSQGKAVKVAVNSKEENSEDFRLHFAQEFGLVHHVLVLLGPLNGLLHPDLRLL